MPAVSVIVPVYNVEKYIHRCVDSILVQTFTDFELILVDDGSPDNCPAICDNYAALDTRIKVLHLENGGVSRARNAGLDAACGDYCTFVDSDDWISPDFLYIATRSLLRTHADIFLAGHYRSIDGEVHETIVIPHSIEVSSSDLSDEEIVQLLEKNYISSSCGKVYSRAMIGATHFPAEMNFGEDLTFLFSLLRKKTKIIAVPDAYYYYCTDQGKVTSLTTSISRKRCWSTVETYKLLLSLAESMQLGDIYMEFVCKRWVSDLIYIEYKILGSNASLLEKYILLKTLLTDKKLRKITMCQEDRFLKRYATRPAVLLAFWLYNNAKSTLKKTGG